jgi:putative CocE/NonD family hydrolase
LPALHLCGLYDHAIAAEFRSWQLAQTAYSNQYLVLDSVDHSWRGLATAGSDAFVLEGQTDFLRRYHEHVQPFVCSAFSMNPYPHDRVCWRPALDVPWREAPNWPPPDAVEHTLWATSKSGTDGTAGSLVSSEPEPQGWVAWTHDATDPVPSRGHAFHELAERPDLSDLTERPDVVDFVTDQLTQTLELAGIATFTADVASSGHPSTLVVALLDLTPDGRAWEVRTGRARIDGDARCGEVSVNLGPVAYVYLPGHRLGIRISSSLFPRLALDSGNESSTWTQWAPTPTRQRVAVGGGGGARLSCQTWVPR